MKRLAYILILATSTITLACGDDGGTTEMPDAAAAADAPAAGGNSGFITPTLPATAYHFENNMWTEVGPADFDCLGAPSEDMASTVDITVTGAVTDFQTANPVPEATVEVFAGVDIGNALAMTTADAEGLYEITLPTGQTRVGFKIGAANALDTYLVNQYFEPGAAAQEEPQRSVSRLTADVLPALVGVTRTPGLGILAGAVRDCAENEVANVIATVSSVQSMPEHLDGAQTFYFSAGTGGSLPVGHDTAPQTKADGLFVVIELPANPDAYLQVWGFTSAQDPATDELTLLAEIPVPVVGDSVITASLDPLRAP